MKKLFLIVLLFLNIIPINAGMLEYMYAKCITTARFICSPIRMVLAPFFMLDLETEKDLHRVMLLELAHVNQKKVQKQFIDLIQSREQFDEYWAESFALYEETFNVKAKLNLNIMAQSKRHDTLCSWEKILTNRQQQLDKYCRSVAKSLIQYDKQIQKSLAETNRKLVE